MTIRQLIKETSAILSPAERRGWWRSMTAVVGTTFLDFFGIASLLPLLYYLIADGDNKKAAIIFGTTALFFIISKSVAGIWLQRFRSRYLTSLFSRLSLSLYEDSFSRGILHIRSHGVSRIGYEITWVCHSFCHNILGTLMKITGDLLLLLLIGGAVVTLAPLSAVILILPLLSLALAYRHLVGERARTEGDRELRARRRQTSVINDTFGGYPDIMVAGAYPFFRDRFISSLGDIRHSRLKIELYNAAVLPLCESSVALSLAAMAFIGGGEDARIALGIFAIAAFRIIPAIRGLIWGWVQIKNASPTLETLSSLKQGDIFSRAITPGNETPKENTSALSPEKDIILGDITFGYSGESKPVLDGFSCRILKGEYVGFRGESGIGKSTLFNIILGLIHPESGCVLVDDVPISDGNRERWLSAVGYVPQEVFVFNASVIANIAPGIDAPDIAKINSVLDEVRLREWADSLSDGVETILGERGQTLSGGERQRLGLARALYRDVTVLMLDEATSSLDPATESEILDTISEARHSRDLTILSIAHRPSSLIHCTKIIEL